jgi:hypothetical protein
MAWWYRLGLTLNWQPPVLCGGPVSRDISGGIKRMGKGNENLVSVPVELNEIFYMPYNLTTWDLRLYFPS